MNHCKAPGCTNPATVEVILFDVYLHDGHVFYEQDMTCPWLCDEHVKQNEEGFRGERKPRSVGSYPFTNQHRAQGFTVYKPIDS